MDLIDITQAYAPGMKRYRSIDDFSCEWIRHYSRGFPMALSRISMVSHLGTHIDSPFHFFENGKKIGDIPLEKLCGEAQVIHACGMPAITRKFLEAAGIGAPRVLFKTDNTEKLKTGTDFDNVYFDEDACAYLAEKGVVLAGIDFFSVDQKGDHSRIAHRALLSNGIVILEAVILDEAPPGNYELFWLPLKVNELEGAPCRAVLRRRETS